jgi:pyrroline-5-carboxylate reductase
VISRDVIKGSDMFKAYETVGVIGGSGMLGHAMSTAMVRRNAVAADQFWISNRSGIAAPLGRKTVNVTTDNQALADACNVIILCVPPAAMNDIKIHAPDKLILSVMAGTTLATISAITGSRRVVRAMSSPAALQGLAYSPWVASDAITDNDRGWIKQLLGACGLADEIFNEAHIDHFTAMTGPVPGFVAYFAQCMTEYATDAGIAPDVADRAIRQLFLAGGTMLAQDGPTPAEHVAGMVDYAGTTAAGLVSMQASPIAQSIADGLDAAVAKARTMGPDLEAYANGRLKARSTISNRS